MSSWGNNDNAANAPYWAVNSTIAPDNPNRARPTLSNVTALYANTTANVYTTNTTIGLFMVDTAEEIVSETQANHPVHSGWNLKKTFDGGRAGRVQWETLVALASVQSDNNADDAVLPDAVITLTQPVTQRNVIREAGGANTVTFSVAGTTVVPDSATLTYKWQVNAGGMSWVDIDNGTNVTTGQPGNMYKTGANTATLILGPTTTGSNNYVFRAVVTATNAGITNSVATATSANGKIVIT
jgi:hypothetical protein